MSPIEQLNNMQIEKEVLNDKITDIMHKLQKNSIKTKLAPRSQVFKIFNKYELKIFMA